MIAGQPRLLEDEYQELDDVARDEEPGPLTDALTTAFGGDLQVWNNKLVEYLNWMSQPNIQ